MKSDKICISNLQWNIGLGNGMAPNRQQAITLICQCHMASLGHNEFKLQEISYHITYHITISRIYCIQKHCWPVVFV